MKSKSRFLFGPIDFILSLVASGTAVCSAGIALNNTPSGIYFAVLVAIALVVSYTVRMRYGVSQTKITADGILLVLLALLTIGFLPTFNSLQPGGGYPSNLIQNSFLSWMLVFGALVSWRDSTLLFQAVPGIALFGLIGAYDTFKFAPGMFFVFLVCTAILFARTNIRAALKEAEDSHNKSADQLDRYEWKTLAGPDWALGSALVVIALSVLGAPVIQSTFRSAAAPLISSNTPLATPQGPIGIGNTGAVSDSVRIGEGPLGKPNDAPVIRVQMPIGRYLRGRSYDTYAQNRWKSVGIETTFMTGGVDVTTFDFTKVFHLDDIPPAGRRLYNFSIEIASPSVHNLFLPGEISTLSISKSQIMVGSDGSSVTSPGITFGDFYRGTFVMPETVLEVGPSDYPPHADARERTALTEYGSTDRVREFAINAAKGQKTDYDKAYAIRTAIAARIKYNLQAPSVPSDHEAVDFALFESHEGYCDLFASSMAQCARAIGLKSRVAAGYLCDSGQTGFAYQTIKDSQYHLWCEIYFKDVGWQIFDATAGAEEVPGFGLGSSWREPDPLRGFGPIIFTTIGLISLGAGYVFIKFLWPKWRASILSALMLHRVINLDSDPRLDLAQRRCAQFMRGIEKKSGIPRQFEQTVREYLRNVSARFGIDGELTSDTIVAIERTLYSAHDPVNVLERMTTLTSAYQNELTRLKKSVKKSA